MLVRSSQFGALAAVVNEAHVRPGRAPIMKEMDTTPGRYRNSRLAACAAGAVLGVIMVALSFLGGQPVYPTGLVIVLFVCVFPLFGWAVIERAAGRARRPRRRWNDFSGITNADYTRAWAEAFGFARRYKALLIVAVPVVIGLWAVMMSSITTLQGQPEHDQAGYFLNDHGSRIPVTKAGYEAALAKQDRLFAAGATLFLIVAGVMTAYRPEPRGAGD
jgi:hypothetical protein